MAVLFTGQVWGCSILHLLFLDRLRPPAWKRPVAFNLSPKNLNQKKKKFLVQASDDKPRLRAVLVTIIFYLRLQCPDYSK